MRALLVVNPKATTTSTRVREVLTHALASEVKLDIAETTHRDHATELAAQAVADGLDVVVALGGDGTVNEVVNGLLQNGPGEGLPSLAVVPAGSTNVFARALGMSNNPVEATGQLLEALLGERRRSIGLGRADDRWFTFNAGLGIDAGAVRRVEQARAKGKTATNPLYVRSALKEFYLGESKRDAVLTLSRPGEEDVELAIALVCNTDPWTYLGTRPVRACPDASFDTGLDVFGLRRLGTVNALRNVGQFLTKTPKPKGKAHYALHDVEELVLSASLPLPFQLDGDGLGSRERVVFRSVADALRVVV